MVPVAVDLLKKYQEKLKQDIKDRKRKTRRIDSAVSEIEQCQARLDDDALAPLPESTGRADTTADQRRRERGTTDG